MSARRTSPWPRLRAPVLILVGGAAVLAIDGARYGWVGVAYFAPIVIALAVGYYVWAGRDSDTAAVIRRQTDERQATIRMQVQALVGRALAVAVAIAYLVAVATKTRLWPYAVLLAVLAVSFVAGWLIYGEHGGGRGEGEDAHRRGSVLRRQRW